MTASETETEGFEWFRPGAYVPGLARVEHDGVRMWWTEATQVYPWDLDVLVIGDPASQGSFKPMNHRTTGKAVMVPMNTKKQRGWRAEIKETVREAWGSRMATSDAVGVALDFVFPRRKSAPVTFTPHKTTTPDLDKITRAAWDAMTHIVFSSDAQVISSAMTKREAEANETPGVRIRVAVIPPVPRPIGRGPR